MQQTRLRQRERRVPRSLALRVHVLTLTGPVLLGLSGCAAKRAASPPPSPPAAWVQRNQPLSPAPVEYEHRPILPAAAAQTPGGTAPPMPTLVPPAPELPPPPEFPQPPQSGSPPPFPFPPPAPAAEDPTEAAASMELPDGQSAATTQAVDELRAKIADLDRQLNEQSAALKSAELKSAQAQEAVEDLTAEFAEWRRELLEVRTALQEQNASDIRALDELQGAIRQLLGDPPPAEDQPESPGSSLPPRTASEPSRGGVSR